MKNFARAALVAAGAALCTPAAAADLDPAALLQGMPLIVLGDAVETSVNHIESLAYVGGNYTSNLLATNTDNMPAYELNGLAGGMFVGGDLNVQNGVNGGNGTIYVGGTATIGGGTPSVPVVDGVGTDPNTGIPVAEMTALFTNLATDLASLSTTAGAYIDTSNSNQPTFVSGAGDAEGIAILNVDETTALSVFGNQNANLAFNLTSNVSLIVNVMVTDLTLRAKLNASSDHVLFNFYNALTLNVGAGPWNSSMLAPNAAVTSANSGQFGSLVAGSLTIGGEIRPFNNTDGYIGSLPSSVLAADVPLPAGVWLIGAGLLALGATARRRGA